MKENMKYLLIAIGFILTACAQLQHGATQPVIMKDARQKIYITSCSGAVEVWGNCYDKARNTCEKGYETVEKKDEANGGRRELMFKCNK
jgi:hypothetical protein